MWQYDMVEMEAMLLYPPSLTIENLDGATDDDLRTWAHNVEALYTVEALIGAVDRIAGLEERLNKLEPNYVDWRRHQVNKRHAEIAAVGMIEQIGIIVGSSADLMMARQLSGVPSCPPIPDAPGRVWDIATAFWHEVVHRGLQVGKGYPMWIPGIQEFSYDEVLAFVQRIWLAFWAVTGLDFTDPQQSADLKSWLGLLSPRASDREEADDVTWHMGEGQAEARERLQHYIKYGGPSKAAEEPDTVITLRGRMGTYD